MGRLGRLAGFGALFAVAGASSAAGQLPTYGVGRAPTAEEVKAWDLTIPPDGQGLPPGRGTAALGKPIYAERCASCHGEKGEDPKYSRLVGGHGSLVTAQPVRTIGSFWQYAATLWSYIRRAQPFDEPGSLTPDQVYAVTAYLLYLNGIVKEDDVLDASTLPRIRMPNREGFVADRVRTWGRRRHDARAENGCRQSRKRGAKRSLFQRQFVQSFMRAGIR